MQDVGACESAVQGVQDLVAFSFTGNIAVQEVLDERQSFVTAHPLMRAWRRHGVFSSHLDLDQITAPRVRTRRSERLDMTGAGTAVARDIGFSRRSWRRPSRMS